MTMPRVDDMLNARAGKGRGAPARHLRRAVRPPQPRRDHPHGGMRRCARRHHPPPPQRRPDGRRRQGPRPVRSNICPWPALRTSVATDPRPEGPRHLGVRHGSRRRLDPHRRGPARGPAAIVIGNEGSGMSRLVAESCDLKVSIPLKGHISSPECLDGRRRAAV